MRLAAPPVSTAALFACGRPAMRPQGLEHGHRCVEVLLPFLFGWAGVVR